MDIRRDIVRAFDRRNIGEWIEFRTDRLDFSVSVNSDEIGFRVIRQKETGFHTFHSMLNGFKVMSMSQPELSDKIIYLRGTASKYDDVVTTRRFHSTGKLHDYLHKMLVALYEFSYGEGGEAILSDSLETGSSTSKERCHYCSVPIDEGDYCKECSKLFKHNTIKSIEKRIVEIDKMFSLCDGINREVQETMTKNLGFESMSKFQTRLRLDKYILKSMLIEKIYNNVQVEPLEKEVEEDINYGEIVKSQL